MRLHLDLLPVPVVTSNRLREDKVRLFAHHTFLLAILHESFEVLGFCVGGRAIFARIPAVGGTGQWVTEQPTFCCWTHVSNMWSAGSSVSSCSVMRYRGV